MDKLGGYAGNILKVDLTTGSITSTPLSPELAAKYLGGAGINAWLAYDCIQPHTSAVSPGNALVFGAGPLVGTLAPGAGRSNFTAKSPIAHFIGTSGSGHMGALKFTGYDHVIVTGKANSPVYLEIGDEVKIREAGHIWGKDTWEAADTIWGELGRKYAVAAIGPAGENLIKDASVITNKYSAFGTTGMGAVLGSKNLKAIAVCGSQGISVADPKRFMELANGLCKEIMDFPFIDYFRSLGTLTTLPDLIKGEPYGSIPYKNCQQVADEEVMKGFDVNMFFDPKMMEEHGNISCLGCPVGCKHFMRIKNGPAMGISCASAPVVCFGGICGLDGWAEVYKCAELCNRLGMCYGSVACLIAMAIELYQRGIIDKKDTGGLELDWQPGVVQDLLQRIAHRKDFGNILADGLLEAPRRIGRGADYYAMQYKGIGCSISDARSSWSLWSSSLLTNVTGQSHSPRELYGQPREVVEATLRAMGISGEDMERVLSGPGEYNVGWLTRWTEDYVFAVECFGVCTFYHQLLNIDINTWAEIYSAATGLQMDGAGLLKAAARGFDIRKAFNIREGGSRKDDTMPRRFLTEPLKARGQMRPPYDSQKLDQMVTDYYEARGWDPEEGTVSPERLAELIR